VEGTIALFIPIAALIAIAFVLGIRLRYQHLDRLAAQETIRSAIDHGQALTPELVVHLTDVGVRNADLRRGVISIAIALALVAFARAIGEEDAVGPLTGIAAFPLLLGLAYFLLHWFANPRDRAAA
jgi:Domain of unknown function (DUF6249)